MNGRYLIEKSKDCQLSPNRISDTVGLRFANPTYPNCPPSPCPLPPVERVQ